MGLGAKLALVPVMLAVYAVVLALVPIATIKVETFQIDDIKSWGFTGPSKDTMPEILKGVYYFDGNQAPKECDGPDSKMCRCAAAVPGAQCWERSPLMLMDYSYCKFGEAAVFGPGGIESAFATAKLVTPSPELLWNTDGKTYPVYCSFKEGIMGTSNAADGDWAAPGGKYIKILAALRAGYEIECGDETCTEASLYLSLAGMRISKFLKYKGGGAAKLTWEMKDGGKLMERREWDDIQGDPYAVQDKATAKEDWSYTQKRLMDRDGNIDPAVMAILKETYGDTVDRITDTGMLVGHAEYNFELSSMLFVGAIAVVGLTLVAIEPACCGGGRKPPMKKDN